jgi:hypothetical protein
MAVMGRPPIDINWEEMDKLLAIQATKDEIAGWFKCSPDTIENKIRDKFQLTFSEYRDQKGAPGKISLRRKQYQTAMSGNVAMQIFLGKNWLGQSDKVQHSNDDAKPFVLAYVPKSQRTEGEGEK